MTPSAVRTMILSVYEEDLAARRVTQAVRKRQIDGIVQFLRWARNRGKADIRSCTRKDLLSYHGFLSEQRSKRSGEILAPSTINDRFGTIRILFTVLYRMSLITHNPAEGLSLKVPDPRGYKRRALSKAEITEFLERIDTTTRVGLRDRALYELIYSSGLRVSEAACLRIADIDFSRRTMIVRGKFDRDRMVPLSEVAHDFLLKYLGEHRGRPEAWVFTGYRGHLTSGVISERFRDYLRDYGMDKKDISTHSIRHSTATHLLENGASIRHVQELLGHHSIESTVRYTHVMSDNLAKIYRKHHPREHDLYEEVDDRYLADLARLT